ncbi:NAD-dependent 4,6-dehydratase LegB [Teredinibacter turnerae]|uniref:NAD-dependent 4,6-dehydratase LegB n=1 Tax=Teredinibacter turnerae TaxID=2426 RepID=UPI00037C4C88|nr:NAD-dependent 4,6-dehydratase LegB [Teredinibacter turnerae]
MNTTEDNVRVLVTGADGFIGSHLVERLLQQGYKVRALAQYNSLNHWGWLEDVPAHPHLEIVTGDILDATCCREITRDIHTVFHLAALIAIPFSYRAPSRYIETNVTGTLNMCQAALDQGVVRFLQTSTSEVYGTAQYVPIDEAHPLQAQSPYSASKIGADALATSFHRSFELPLTIVRPFNTYGPRQSARAVIPTIITQIAAGAESIQLGDLSPTRDFSFVTDTCDGFIALANCPQAIGETVNMGSNFEISVADALEKIREIMGSNVKFMTDEARLRPSASEVMRLWCDNSKYRALTGKQPEFSIDDGLRATIEWFCKPENLAKYKPGIYNV